MRQVKIGVIGLGWFGEKHCEVLSGIPQVEVAAVCTRTESRLNEVGDRFRIAADKRYTDYHALLADPEIEAVSITTMWDQHVGPAVAALEAGKHVFLEKPMASTVEDCDSIVEAANRASGHFLVGHICRFNPRYAAAREAIEAGKIGKVISMYSRRNLPAWVGASVLDKIGPIIGDCVHDTDLMFWMSGSKGVSAYAQTVQFRNHANPDLGQVMYRLENGASCILESVWCLPDTTPFQIDERLEIVGTEGSVSIHDTHPNLMIVDKDGSRCPDTTYWPDLRGQVRGALRDELEYFADGILKGERPTIITPEESREAVRACLAAEASARSGEVVKIG
ncbi:MAG: Gfo/Idh/MocA family oxidoreductase [Verrucomicrobiae bacterium]|nr:Gfo/Idh/MocA family oxidoreductase [Verrucomicrobiae bacterium]MCB1090590.1 Gfo/Idh/MocA family oxidoreductase [Verrucomicrobiae bacterium]